MQLVRAYCPIEGQAPLLSRFRRVRNPCGILRLQSAAAGEPFDRLQACLLVSEVTEAKRTALKRSKQRESGRCQKPMRRENHHRRALEAADLRRLTPRPIAAGRRVAETLSQRATSGSRLRSCRHATGSPTASCEFLARDSTDSRETIGFQAGRLLYVLRVRFPLRVSQPSMWKPNPPRTVGSDRASPVHISSKDIRPRFLFGQSAVIFPG